MRAERLKRTPWACVVGPRPCAFLVPALAATMLAALLLCGCGSTAPVSAHPRRRVPEVSVSASVIARAARLTAMRPGYGFRLGVKLESTRLQGQAQVSGVGAFENPTDAGRLQITANLPGLLAALSPLSTTVLSDRARIAVKVPGSLVSELHGTVKPWITTDVRALMTLAGLPAGTLGGRLSPQAALRQLARFSSGRAKRIDADSYRETIAHLGTVQVTLDPGTGLIRELRAAYAAPHLGGLRAQLTLRFVSYRRQSIPAFPTESSTTHLNSLVKQLAGFGA